jgi:hypothetical protein
MINGIGKANIQTQVAKVRPDAYQSDSVREVRERAQAIQQKTTAEERNNLVRLNQFLDQEKPLRDNLPRGYYLDISI